MIRTGFFVGALAAGVLVLPLSFAVPANAADFKGKTISMVIGNAAGGGTDGSGRLLQPFFEKYLPGNPSVVIRNMPGAGGVSALNYVFTQTPPDGLTLMVGANSQVNPVNFRKANGTYEPHKFEHIGGLGRGGSVLMVSKDGQTRLLDKSKPPVAFGVIDAARASSQVAGWGVEYLGWNVKWVVGYQGSNETSMALERNEIDMSTTGNLFLIKRLIDSGKFVILTQSGGVDETGKYVGRPEFGNAPVFAALVKDKVKDPVALEAFGYWESADSLDKWISLSAGTPKDIVEAYREAFKKIAADPDFMERGKKIAEDLAPMSWQDIDRLIGQMARVTPDTENFIKVMLRKQGVQID